MMKDFQQYLKTIPWFDVLLIGTTILAGYLIAKIISYYVGRKVEERFDQTSGLIARKLIYYGMLGVILLIVLRALDASIGALLAAGGFFGIAIGFASQTAVSNVISGIFLIFERPFDVADAIRVDGQFGMVESIDLLSTKIRTFDNLYWRMPNEKLLKSDIFTITKYDVRRMDVAASVSYGDDIQRARDVLLETAEANPKILAQPEPVTLVDSMGESGINLTLRYWFERNDFLEVKSEITQQIKVALEEAGCTIPFPHRTIYVRDEEKWEELEKLNREQQANHPEQ